MSTEGGKGEGGGGDLFGTPRIVYFDNVEHSHV